MIGERLRQVPPADGARIGLSCAGTRRDRSKSPCRRRRTSSPGGYAPAITGAAYPTRAALLDDVAAIIRAEIEALAAEGVPYIQLDNPHYPDYVDDDKRAQWAALGIDPDEALAEDIAADNACLGGVDRATVTLAMHLCRGNGRSAPGTPVAVLPHRRAGIRRHRRRSAAGVRQRPRRELRRRCATCRRARPWSSAW
ncbi:MAG: hypothetical protein U0531_12055 [Dehalococcoidia bacterium]